MPSKSCKNRRRREKKKNPDGNASQSIHCFRTSLDKAIILNPAIDRAFFSSIAN
jgi:hypothetical protein